MMRILFPAFLLIVTAAHASAQPAARVLVVPFENAQRDPRVHWLSEASAVLLADALNARGTGAITRGERARAFEQLTDAFDIPIAQQQVGGTLIDRSQGLGDIVDENRHREIDSG